MEDHEHAVKVGVSFLTQFYNVLAEATEDVAHFYMEDSNLCYNTEVCVKGPQGIRDAFLEIGFKNMTVDVRSASFLPGFNEEVLVVVSGTYTPNNDKVTRKISHTFQLGKIEGSYVIVNDVVVVVDGPNFIAGQGPSAEESSSAAAAVDEEGEQVDAEQQEGGNEEDGDDDEEYDEEEEEEMEEEVEVEEAEEQGQEEEDVVTGEAEEDPVPEDVVGDEEVENNEGNVVPESDDTQEQGPEKKSEGKGESGGKKKDDRKSKGDKKGGKSGKGGKKSEESPSEGGGSTTFSWAQMAAAPAKQPASGAPPAPSGGAAPKKAAAKKTQPAPAKEKAAVPNGKPVGKSKKDMMEEKRKLAIYIKERPKDVSETRLEEFFAQYGAVASVELPQNKKFAIVNFKSKDTVQKVVTAGPIVVDGHTLSCEERVPPAPKKPVKSAGGGGSGSGSGSGRGRGGKAGTGKSSNAAKRGGASGSASTAAKAGKGNKQ